MPELPDLQAFSHNLEKRMCNKAVVEILLSSKKSNVSLQKLKSALVNQRITRIYRDGKELRFVFSNDNMLGLHLMLHGELHLVAQEENVKFSLFEIHFEDQQKFVLSDFQKQARPNLNPEPIDVPDALSEEMSLKYLEALMAKKKAVVKNVLLDQSQIRGIGNAYADEILWDAKIAPQSICNQIPPEATKALFKSIKKVLKDAIKHILKDQPDIISGELRTFLKIHQKENPKSPTGQTIEIQKNGARKTYFTNEQILYA